MLLSESLIHLFYFMNTSNFPYFSRLPANPLRTSLPKNACTSVSTHTASQPTTLVRIFLDMNLILCITQNTFIWNIVSIYLTHNTKYSNIHYQTKNQKSKSPTFKNIFIYHLSTTPNIHLFQHLVHPPATHTANLIIKWHYRPRVNSTYWINILSE